MSTRSLTLVYEKGINSRKLMCMYKHYDGYLSGYGKMLKDFLRNKNICNGIGLTSELGEWANGMGCLAAQIVKHFKNSLGDVYLEPVLDEIPDLWQEYEYHIYLKEFEGKMKIHARIYKVEIGMIRRLLFDGIVEDMPESDRDLRNVSDSSKIGGRDDLDEKAV